MRFSLARSALFVIAASFSLSASAQVRDYVPVVRPVYHEATVSFLETLSDSLRRDGYDSAAAALEAYVSGGFGSGFVVVAQDGNDYVVTNRHVVAQAASIKLEFSKADGSQTLYTDCPVFAVDEDLDIALIAFPKRSKPFKAGLAFSLTPTEDGMEVWSAGYPGLGREPSWQLGKGTVTNSAARVAALADPATTSLIQHSAQVDPGNSGGPLLVADRSSPSGYAVIGINTWKAYDRQAANFSIPSAAIQRFIAASLAESATPRSQSGRLEARCRDFVGAAARRDDETYKGLARYVSYALVASDGEALLKKALAVAPTRVRDDIIAVFGSVSPIEGIRLAVAYAISLSLAEGDGGEPLGFVRVEGNAESETSAVPVRFKREGKELSLSWTREHGIWRLASYPFDIDVAEGKNGKEAGTVAFTFDETPYNVLVSVGTDIALSSSGNLLWEAGLSFVPDCYLAFVGAAGFSSSSRDDGYASESGALLRLKAGARCQIPIRGPSLACIPYAGLGAGMLFDTSNVEASGLFALAEGGVQVGLGAIPSLFLGAAYTAYLSAPEGADASSRIALWLGFGL